MRFCECVCVCASCLAASCSCTQCTCRTSCPGFLHAPTTCNLQLATGNNSNMILSNRSEALVLTCLIFDQQIAALRKQITTLKSRKISEDEGNVDTGASAKHNERTKSSVSWANDARKHIATWLTETAWHRQMSPPTACAHSQVVAAAFPVCSQR